MPKDTTLIDSPYPLTLDELKAHFQAHDFTTEQSSYDPSKATEAQNQIYVKAKRLFAEEWDRQQKAMGGSSSLRNFSDAYPLQVLENANEDLVAGTVTQILADSDLTERIFASLEPMILSALSTYAESMGKVCDDLSDAEVEMVIAQFTSELQGNAMNLLMLTENVPQLLSELKLMQTHEDFSNDTIENWDKIDFDRKWDHTRTRIGRLLSAEDIELDVLERGQNVLDDGEEYSVEEQIFEQQLEEAFMETLDSTELEICRLRRLHYTQAQIAEALGYKTHSAITKRLAKMREKFDAVARKRFAQRLRSSLEDIHSSHCLMYEIYFHGGAIEKAEAETAYFSINGQYIKDRVKYMHLKMKNKHSEALPHIESSVSHTLHWLFWDIHNLASSYRCLDDRESMYKVYKLEHDLLNALSYYNGNYFAYYFQSTVRLAQNAAQKGETEHCFTYLEEMMNALRRLQMQKNQGCADACILFAGRDEKQTAKMSKSTVLECLAWKSFDGIRDTASFRAIYDEVNSWTETF